VARRQRLARLDEKGPPPVREPLGAQEQDVRAVPLREAPGELVRVGDEEDLRTRLDERGQDALGDVGALALVRGRERLVEEQDGSRREVVDELAEPLELLVELAAGHRAVLATPEVGEQVVPNIRLEGRRPDEHPGLEHELGDRDPPQERRLSAAVGSGDQDQRSPVRIEVVPDRRHPRPKGKPDVDEPSCGQPGRAARSRLRKGHRHAEGLEPVEEIQAREMERRLESDHPEEAQDVVDRLARRVGHETDAPGPQLRQGLSGAVVAVRDDDRVGPSRAAAEEPAPAETRRSEKDEPGPGIPAPEASVHGDSLGQRQQPAVLVELPEVLVVELGSEDVEETAKAIRPDDVAVRVGNGAELPEHRHQRLERADGHAQRELGTVGPDPPRPSLTLDRRVAQVVQLARHRGLVDAVPEDALAVADGRGIGEARQEDLPRDVAQVSIATGHRGDQVIEPQVLDHRLVPSRRGRRELDIGVGMEQQRSHDESRSLRRS